MKSDEKEKIALDRIKNSPLRVNPTDSYREVGMPDSISIKEFLEKDAPLKP